jgi:hypothetical protein
MRNLKLYLVIALILLFMLGVSGCMSKNTAKPLDITQNYLQEKYGVPFTFVENYGARMGGDQYQYLFSCSVFQDEKILAMYTALDDGEYECSDNYMSYYFKSETKSALENIVKSVYGDGKVFYTVSQSPLPGSYDLNTPFERFILENSKDIIASMVIVGDNRIDKEADLEALRIAAVRDKVFFTGKLYYANEGNYDAIDASNINKYESMTNWYSDFCSFSLEADGTFDYANWR